MVHEGKEESLSEDLLKFLFAGVMNRIRKTSTVDVLFSGKTKVAYDVAEKMFLDFIFTQNSPTYIQEWTLPHLILPFRINPMYLFKTQNKTKFPFVSLPNVVLGGKIQFVTNESFAPAENLVKNTFPEFAPHTFGSGTKTLPQKKKKLDFFFHSSLSWTSL